MKRCAAALALILGLILGLWRDSAAGRHKASGASQQSAAQVAAGRLLQKGIAALLNRDFAAAGQALAAAYRQWPQPELLYYLGTLAQAEGRTLDAQDLMRRYLSDPRLADPRLADPHQGSAAESPTQKDAARILALPRPPYGKLQVDGAAESIVLVDGRLVGSLPLSQPLLITPGPHKVTLEAHGLLHEEPIEIKVARFLELRYSAATNSVISAVVPVMLVIDELHGDSAGEPPGPGQVVTATLGRAIDQALQQAHFSPLRRAEALAGARDRNLVSCLDTLPCQAQLARENGADYALRVLDFSADVSPRKLVLELLHAAVGELAVRLTASCPASCGPGDAAELFQKLVPELLAEARKRQFGRLQVDSKPAGAEVFSGERRLGLTPLERVLWSGPMELELRHPGMLSERRKLTVPDGNQVALTIELRPIPLALRLHLVQPPRPRWRYYAGAGVAGAGLIFLGIGSSALAANNTCVGDPPDGSLCMIVHRTLGVGGPLLGAGLGLLAGGALLIGIPPPKRLEAERPGAP